MRSNSEWVCGCGARAIGIEMYESHKNACPRLKYPAPGIDVVDLELDLENAAKERLERIATAVLAGYAANAAVNPNTSSDPKLAEWSVGQARALIAELDSAPSPSPATEATKGTT